MRATLHCPHSSGGLAEHIHYQARALARKGHDVSLLCPHDFLPGKAIEYRVRRLYPSLGRSGSSGRGLKKIARLLWKGCLYLYIQWRLAFEVLKHRPDFVLLDSYIEYLAPLWVWPHLILAKWLKIPYVANVHEPYRVFVVGPRWWHEWSVRLAYAPLRICTIHQPLTDRGVIPPHVMVRETPVGVYDLQEKGVDRVGLRKAWGVPPDSVCCLSFGFIRDNKNIDLLIKALPENPEVFLVVLGSAQSSEHKPLSFYKDLARQVGVEKRVFFRDDFVADEALAGTFAAADIIALTYNAGFRSQSGVLNVAARARKPVLASSGESPLKTCVQRFCLGQFVEPDNLAALTKGLEQLCLRSRGAAVDDPKPDWDGYAAYASWDTNVSIILDAIGSAARES